MSPGQEPLLFFVEDDEADREITREAFRECGIPVQFLEVDNGAEAVERLARLAEDPQGPRPALILLDVNLPGRSGTEILAFIKGHERLREIPTVILSTSTAPSDKRRCTQLGAEAYFTKVHRFDDLLAVVQQLGRFLDGGPPARTCA